MRFDLITIFPEFFAGPLEHGIVRRAREAGLVQIQVQDLREFTRDRHRTVDDRPFGGGEGMVMKPEPLFEAVETLLGQPGPTLSGKAPERVGHPQTASEGSSGAPLFAPGSREGWAPGIAVVLLSAAGKLFRQADARRLAQMQRVVLICGRYEGVDERVAKHLATDEYAIGDFVMSGGELPAAMILDAATRLIPGALGNEDSTVNESFSAGENEEMGAQQAAGAARSPTFTSHESQVRNRGILDFPHYTRPQEFRGWSVPDVLMSGHHEQVRRWRRKMALAKTMRNRPELMAGISLSKEDHALLDEIKTENL